jgi:hypothetical protein
MTCAIAEICMFVPSSPCSECGGPVTSLVSQQSHPAQGPPLAHPLAPALLLLQSNGSGGALLVEGQVALDAPVFTDNQAGGVVSHSCTQNKAMSGRASPRMPLPCPSRRGSHRAHVLHRRALVGRRAACSWLSGCLMPAVERRWSDCCGGPQCQPDGSGRPFPRELRQCK